MQTSVHLENKTEDFIKTEWDISMYMNRLPSTKMEVMILINNNFDQEVTKVVKDPKGNFIILEITVQKQRIILANIYGPNGDKPQFYKKLKQKIDEFETEKIIICGDWNVVLDSSLDTENYKTINNQNARSVVLSLLDNMDYMDAGRILNEDKKRFYLEKIIPWKKTGTFGLLSD